MLERIGLFSLLIFSKKLQKWQLYSVKSARDVLMGGKWNILKASQQISTTTEQQNLHVSHVFMWPVSRKVWKWPIEERPKKKGIRFVWNANVHNSQRCLLTLSRVVCVCCAVSILSVCLSVHPSFRPSSCAAVQNHHDRLNQWSSPEPVSHNPSMSLDHTNVVSMSSASACVCVWERELSW